MFADKSYLADIPKDLEESAMVDGDTHLGAFWRVVLPLAKPGLAATAAAPRTGTR